MCTRDHSLRSVRSEKPSIGSFVRDFFRPPLDFFVLCAEPMREFRDVGALSSSRGGEAENYDGACLD